VRHDRCWVGLVTLTVLALSACSGDTSSATPTPTPNGVESLSANQILDVARKNAKAQTSMRIKGKGGCPQVGDFGADMQLRSDGMGTGTVKTSSGTVKLVTTPGTIYVQAPATFWRTQTTPKGVAQIGTKWVKFPSVANPCLYALGSFPDLLTNYLDIPGSPTKVKSVSIFDVPAQLVNLPPDYSLWIASTGQALPIYVSSTSTGLAMAIGQWGAPVEVAVPMTADVLVSSDLVTK